MKEEIVRKLLVESSPTARANIRLEDALATTPALAWYWGEAYEDSYAKSQADQEWASCLTELADFWFRLARELDRAAYEVVERARGGTLSRQEAISFLAEIYDVQTRVAEEALGLNWKDATFHCLRAIRRGWEDEAQFYNCIKLFLSYF